MNTNEYPNPHRYTGHDLILKITQNIERFACLLNL
jgi:hypothetical protein